MKPTTPSQSLKFAGYRLTPDKQARLFLPGQGQEDVRAEVIRPGQEQPAPVTLKRQGDYWISDEALPLGSAYRFVVNNNPQLDFLEVVSKGDQAYNLISPHEAYAPRRSVVIADIFLDALTDRAKLEQLVRENGGMFPMRNHFNQFGGDEKALREILPKLREAGFSSLLFKPFIGGDNLSSHKYWTTDPYVLNNSFSSKEAFKDFLNQSLSSGMKIYADGAFVNQGLNGAQFLSNLAHGFRSPYWDWFTYEEDAKPAGQIVYPKHAYEGFNLGILPTRLDKDGHRTLAYDRFDFRIINDPRQKDTYDPKQYTYVELYDPNTETPDGQPKKAPHHIANSEDSVQKYRFPVSPEEVMKKFDELYSPGQHLTEEGKKRALMEWNCFRDGRPAFRLSAASLDDSAFKWDGQIDVAKMNMKNPEVVAYLDGAVSYWSRFVQNTYTDTVARALAQAKLAESDATPEKWVEAITQKDGAAKPNQVLPPVVFPEFEAITAEEARSAMEKAEPDIEARETGDTLATTVLREYPLMALPLPTVFKAVLSYPKLTAMLSEPPASKPRRFLASLFAPLAKIPVLGTLFRWIQNVILPPPYKADLTRTMDDIVDRMAPAAREKLRHGKLQSMVSDALGEAIFLQAFTGQTSTDPKAVEEGFYKTVPQAILKSDPETAALMLPRFLKHRLASLDKTVIARDIEQKLAGLDPQLVALADAVLQKREYGLNWRIDAAKDVADMDRIRNLDPADRAPEFEKEIEFVQQFWEKLGGSIRKVFPKSAIIAELTDFELLSNKDVANKMMAKLFNTGVFTSSPNMTYLYSQVHQLVNFAQRPDEFGGSQMSPSAFADYTIKGMSQNMSFPALRQLQNLTSSHDYANSSHALLINPAIFTTDHLKWWGLKDDLLEVTTELQNKACFTDARARLADLGDLGRVLHRLNELANRPDVLAQLPPEVKAYHSETTKKWGATYDEMKGIAATLISKPEAIAQFSQELQAKLNEKAAQGLDKFDMSLDEFEWIAQELAQHPAAQNYLTADQLALFKDKIRHRPVHWEPTPLELKPRFIQALFAAIRPEDLGITAEQAQRLQVTLTERIAENSEARAMRGVITNAMLGLDLQSLGFSKPRAETFTRAFYQALDAAVKEWGRHYGYQPLDIALDNAFKHLDNTWARGLNADKAEAIKTAVKTRLYADATRPVLAKLLRIFAIQNALPGNPSVYLPDLFAQGGSEFIKNMFVQNRNLIRVDKLANDDDFQAFFQQTGDIFKTRQHLPALNDGVILPLPADDANGILPIVRDNGEQQVVVLINTGKPNEVPWNQKVGTGAGYTDIQPTQPVCRNYKPDLSALKLAPGTRYKDAQTGETYTLNAEGRLTDDRGNGLDIGIARMLVRE